jgi:hypothetical protein
MRQRAARLAHVQNTNSQSNLPDIGQKIADKVNRDGGAERCADPAVQQSIAVAWGLMTSDDQRLTALARSLVRSAQPHDANTCSRLRSSPGVGKI